MINRRVLIIPIQEYGTVVKVRKDVTGGHIFDVERDSDKSRHICRVWEIQPIYGDEV